MYSDVKFNLNGKVAIVTGASSGIGRDCALAFAEAGARTVVLARRIEKLQSLVDQIKAGGGTALAVQCDVSDEEQTQRAVKEVYDAFGRVDILVNNAGTTMRSVPGDNVEKSWDRCIRTNLRGPWLMCRAVLPYMEAQGKGRIINVSSINAVRAYKDIPIQPYYASKTGLLGLTKGIAAYYGSKGITCNAVQPGLFHTEMTGNWVFSEQGKDDFMDIMRHTPMERPGNPGEMNGAILFFASDLSDYVTGQVIAVDGGFTICM